VISHAARRKAGGAQKLDYIINIYGSILRESHDAFSAAVEAYWLEREMGAAGIETKVSALADQEALKPGL
jgi:hypothetical protein